MKITIETYRIFCWVTVGLLLLSGVGIVLKLPFLLATLPALILCCLYSVLVAITNIRRKHIRAYWKGGDKELVIPFQESRGCDFIAYDGEGNEYRIGPLRTRRCPDKLC